MSLEVPIWQKIWKNCCLIEKLDDGFVVGLCNNSEIVPNITDVFEEVSKNALWNGTKEWFKADQKGVDNSVEFGGSSGRCLDLLPNQVRAVVSNLFSLRIVVIESRTDSPFVRTLELPYLVAAAN